MLSKKRTKLKYYEFWVGWATSFGCPPRGSMPFLVPTRRRFLVPNVPLGRTEVTLFVLMFIIWVNNFKNQDRIKPSTKIRRSLVWTDNSQIGFQASPKVADFSV